ncbi:MAG: HPr kinase/phosphatase C-terminal domain-containing protein [Rhodospirillales bacterium]|nr:HPr kinase/phosphatase C-terminal domain-containing protein [Rhodospirillales bacterium]
MEQVHASCVAMDGLGVLIRGKAGSGKSDLAARLIDQDGRLVADDRVDLAAREGALIASAPAAIAGLLEVRGVGILRMAHLTEATIGLIVDMVGPDDVERVPEPAFCDYMGVVVPLLRIWPFEPSAAAKVRFAVAALKGSVSWVS